jgi:hypothetical protein
MEKDWEDMTVDEKLDALRSENADQIKIDLRLSSGIDDLALQTTAFFAIVGAMSENGLPQVDRVEAWSERLRLVNGVGGDVPAFPKSLHANPVDHSTPGKFAKGLKFIKNQGTYVYINYYARGADHRVCRLLIGKKRGGGLNACFRG